ncbi:MAG: fused MFS/spermidine synthase [Bacteroidetes bacterium]|nr:fused MFS/spermidine synthase [Bacteroidota bacterium]
MPDINKNGLKVSVIVLGFSAVMAQVILLREFLAVFSGNELVIGVILANWMFLTGLGAFSGRISHRIKSKPVAIISAHFLLGILPLVTVVLLRLLRNSLIPAGEMTGLTGSLTGSFVLLLPFCLVSGFMFSLLCTQFTETTGENRTGNVYGLEAVGSIAGGLLFNLIMIYLFQAMTSLIVLMSINFLTALLLLFHFARRMVAVLLIPFVITLILIPLLLPLDSSTLALLYPGQDIALCKDTPYGRLVVTGTGEQVNFFENGSLLFSTGDVIEKEEAVHFGICQRPEAKNILLVGGGIGGMTDEIAKYGVEMTDYLEINPWLTEAAARVTDYSPGRNVTVINRDARLFVRNTDAKYDVALINLPPPSTAQLNRFFTIEFFRALKQHLTRNGVVSTALPSTENYVSEQAAALNSSVYNTLREVFANVAVVPGGKNYYIASDSTLDIAIAKAIERAGIENVYVNQYYIDDQLLQQRSDFITRNLDAGADINQDFFPVAFYNQMRYWMSQFGTNWLLVLPLVILIIVFLVIRGNPVTIGMFAVGFSASSLEMILLMAFQVIYGYVFQMTGVIITVFMAGLAAGSLYFQRFVKSPSKGSYAVIQLLIAVYAIVLPGVLIALKSAEGYSFLIHVVFLVLTLIIAVLVGVEFSVASRITKQPVYKGASDLYGMDMMGSALGALLVSVLLIPLLGVMYSCFCIGALNLIGAGVAWRGRIL